MMNFYLVNMCWPFGQHLLTKYTLYFVYKNTVFGYHKGLKTNGGQNIVVKHDLGFETCSLTPNLKNVSHPGSFDELYQILEKKRILVILAFFAIFGIFVCILYMFLMRFMRILMINEQCDFWMIIIDTGNNQVPVFNLVKLN